MIATVRRLVCVFRRPGLELRAVDRPRCHRVPGRRAHGDGRVPHLRAAEQPPILSLTVTIVAVRFFALSRPLARYLERLASHDLAFRALQRIRTRFYRLIEPLAPQLEGYRGELLTRMVGDVDALQGMYLRASSARRSSRSSRQRPVSEPRRRSCPWQQPCSRSG